MKLRRVFIANRGEIALRIVRAARKLGLETVLGASAVDRESLAAREADRVVVLGPAAARSSYLNARLVVHAAIGAGCDALHPGYGFLSERASLARLCEENGIVFVGPSAESIEAVGDKLAARRLAKAAGVAMTPGSDKIASTDEAIAYAKQIGFPVVTKASAGGGGRGMVVARDVQSLEEGFSGPRPRPRKRSATARFISSASSSAHVTSKCKSWGSATGACYISANGTARCSVDIKR